MAANTPPYVDLPSPPASNIQPPGDADVRGNDYGDGKQYPNDEYQKAIDYMNSIRSRVLSKNRFMLLLRGSLPAYRALQHKTLPLAGSSPPHYDAP